MCVRKSEIELSISKLYDKKVSLKEVSQRNSSCRKFFEMLY